MLAPENRMWSTHNAAHRTCVLHLCVGVSVLNCKKKKKHVTASVRGSDADTSHFLCFPSVYKQNKNSSEQHDMNALSFGRVWITSQGEEI